MKILSILNNYKNSKSCCLADICINTSLEKTFKNKGSIIELYMVYKRSKANSTSSIPNHKADISPSAENWQAPPAELPSEMAPSNLMHALALLPQSCQNPHCTCIRI